MLIRKRNDEDNLELTDLWERTVRATHSFLGEDDIVYYRPRVLRDYLPAVEVWVAEDDAGVIAGFVGISGDKVEMLFVDPDKHGRGIGRRLLKRVEEGREILRIDVNEQNEAAHAFYRQYGFVEVGRSDCDSTGRPFPLIHMEKVV